MTRVSHHPLALVLAATLALAACDATLDPAETSDAADLTEVEVAAAAEIIGSALAEDDGGLVASARDLTAAITETGMADGPRVVRFGSRDQRPACRGGYSLTYDEATGTHVVGYRCGFQNDAIEQGYTVRLSYQYRDADGGFLARPWADWDAVDSVAFGGSRAGFVRTFRGGSLRSESTFEQEGRWTLSRLADDGTPALLAGRQSRTGTRVHVTPNGRASRAFSVQMSSRQIQIREGADGLTFAASGEIAYVLTIEVVRGGRTTSRTVEGTITLEGDGHALLRIVGLGAVYRVSLADGQTDRSA